MINLKIRKRKVLAEFLQSKENNNFVCNCKNCDHAFSALEKFIDFLNYKIKNNEV